MASTSASPRSDEGPHPHTGRLPTGYDVARLAGVSQATVSLVLSQPAGRQRVSPSTQERVRAAAKALGYRPQATGRQLRLGRTGLILLAVPNIRGPYFARILAGAHDGAESEGLTVVVSSQWNSETLARTMTANQFDGMVVCSPNDRQIGDFQTDAPIVFLDADPALAGPGRPVVELDLASGMRSAVAHLADLGHRRVGHLRHLRDAHTFRVRQAAFEDEVAKRGLQVVEHGMPPGEGLEAATAAAHVLLADTARPHAVVCDDDVLAVGVYHAAAERGLRVPEDISVVGIDDIDAAALLNPGLTTVDLHGEELGRAGLVTVAALLRGEPAAPLSAVPTELILRRSTCRAS